jgi:hypothetical protein
VVNDSELIAQQARRIADLQERLMDFEEAADTIRNVVYCIGGPLNDNKLGYTREQMINFDRIVKALPNV